MRGGEAVWESQVVHLLSPWNADVAVLTTSPLPAYMANRVRYYWPLANISTPADLSRWFDSHQQAGQPAWRSYCQLRSHFTFFGGTDQPGCRKHSGAHVFVQRFLLAEQVRKLKLVAEYDFFVLTRSDYLYLCDHPPLSVFLSSAASGARGFVPKFEGWGGYTDRHLLVHSSVFFDFVDVLPPLLSNFTFWRDLLLRNNGYNPESLLRIVWEERHLNVSYMGDFQPMALAAHSGSGEIQGWSTGIAGMPTLFTLFSLKFKYPTEILAAAFQCGLPFPANLTNNGTMKFHQLKKRTMPALLHVWDSVVVGILEENHARYKALPP